jgi:signal transduction histidine kinase
MQEKLASLGALTAGIAHEIKNPLNFVNNFSRLSVGLIGDVMDEVNSHKDRLPPEGMQVIEESLHDLKLNLGKIREHGQRADSIVQNMLLHSRGHSDHRVRSDINELLKEYVALAYHGFRARHPDFNVIIEHDHDTSVPPLEVAPQDIGRVIVNLVENAFYATRQKRASAANFSPVVSFRTVNLGNRVEIRIRDNGSGVADDIRHKIFNPFFTTKPPGEGTGLGLSITFDIVMAHQGELRLESEPGRFSEFIVSLPSRPVFEVRAASPSLKSLHMETDGTQNTGRR